MWTREVRLVSSVLWSWCMEQAGSRTGCPTSGHSALCSVPPTAEFVPTGDEENLFCSVVVSVTKRSENFWKLCLHSRNGTEMPQDCKFCSLGHELGCVCVCVCIHTHR